MNRLLYAAVCVTVLGAAGSAAAQNPYFRPSPLAPRPGLSPYLNLLRGGDPASNYYLGTLPERERRLNTQRFSTAINDLERRTAATPPTEIDELVPSLSQTGHPTGFNNTAGYFGGNIPVVRPSVPVRRPPTRGRGR